ncbi:serine/threonine protein kinase [Actinophytocola sp. S1-96]|uniref:non-specific serine/threonine protein kinase n=2 Tax=Actinophytocola gossypii TaxID=2812003 RepID=A0ABT2JER3_9PSEU|nr:serine/threonine protein kinase [Actinophytocola gossypii]
MGVVWKAQDERLGRVVAIKRLLVRYALSDTTAEETRRRAMREARIAARLQHRNAIAMFDVAEHDGDPCLIMEFLPSRSLSAVLAERGTLPPNEVAEIGAQVASALAAAHAVGIVHRDIKPGNILLADNGTVKITDFGISKALDDGTVTTQNGIAGTPAYLAPEIARGEDPSRASDVFSLGSTLYHAVEGRPPFGTNTNPLALLHAVASGNVPPARNAGPLAGTLTSLMRTEPSTRPSMQDAATTLAAIPTLPATPVPTPPVPVAVLPQPTTPAATSVATAPATAALPTAATTPRPARPVRQPQRNLVLVAIAAVLVLAGVVTTILLNNSSGAEDPPDQAGTQPTLTGQPPSDGGEPSTPPSSEESSSPPPANPIVPDAPVTDYSAAGNTVIDYYNNFDNPQARWNLLSSNAKAQFGGLAAFKEYWSQYSSVSSRNAQGVTPNADGSVNVPVDVTYTKGDGSVEEKRHVRVSREGGQLVVDSMAQ